MYANQDLLERKIRELLERLKKCNDELAAKTSNIADLEKKIASMDSNNQALEQQITRLQQDLVSITTDRNRLNQQIILNTQEITRLNTLLAQEQASKKDWEQQLAVLQAQIQIKEQEIIRLHQELDKLRTIPAAITIPQPPSRIPRPRAVKPVSVTPEPILNPISIITQIIKDINQINTDGSDKQTSYDAIIRNRDELIKIITDYGLENE